MNCYLLCTATCYELLLLTLHTCIVSIDNKCYQCTWFLDANYKDKSIEFEASDCITNVSTELLASKIMQLIYRLSSYQRRRVCPGELSWVECPGDVLMSFGTNQ